MHVYNCFFCKCWILYLGHIERDLWSQCVDNKHVMHPYSQKQSLGNVSWDYFCEGYALPNKGSIAQHITQKHLDPIQFFLAKKYGNSLHTPENKHQIIELQFNGGLEDDTLRSTFSGVSNCPTTSVILKRSQPWVWTSGGIVPGALANAIALWLVRRTTFLGLENLAVFLRFIDGFSFDEKSRLTRQMIYTHTHAINVYTS